MLPLSEADPEIKAKVEEMVGRCVCGAAQVAINVERVHNGLLPEYDYECFYHHFGEEVAALLRDNRRLKRALARVSHYNQLLRKATP